MARMAAGARKRADGTLEKRFTVEGKRYSVYGKSTKEILEKEQQLRRDIETGIYAQNRNVTLDHYYAEWIEQRRHIIKGQTLLNYKASYRKHIQPAFGNRKIRTIERREVAAFQRQLAEQLTASTCKYVMAILQTILADAMRDDIIAKNPAAGMAAVKSSKPKATETIHRALTVEEQLAFMQEMRTDYYYSFVAMMLSTGMRCGEVAALQWQDIDSKAGMIHVRRTATRQENGLLTIGTSPKTAAGVRDIPITENVRTVLHEQRKQLGAVPMPTVTIFPSPNGMIVRADRVNDAIDKALVRLEQKGTHIDHFSSHAFRDTFATRYIEGGGSMQTLKTILGHNSLAMTADLYSHVMPNTKQEEMNSVHIAI